MIRDDESCIFDTAECGEVVMWDASGEPWCARCRDEVRRDTVAAGLNDPDRPLN